jgi:hypothetical protein
VGKKEGENSMKKKSEESLQISISSYIKLQYPEVIFTSESSGLRLTKGQAVKAKKQRSERGLPDLMIFEPRSGYHGLLIELKREGQTPFKKNGELRAGEHLREQVEVLKRLSKKGYAACFCVGFDETKKMIDFYMQLEK